ncbi:MAG: hypothetical protein ACLFQF_02940, partial [Rhodosalinus sp.]
MSRPAHRPATAMALVLGLFAPMPVVAQQSLPACGPGSGLPCVDEISGATMDSAEDLRDLYEARDQDTGFIDDLEDDTEAEAGDGEAAGAETQAEDAADPPGSDDRDAAGPPADA